MCMQNRVDKAKLQMTDDESWKTLVVHLASVHTWSLEHLSDLSVAMKEKFAKMVMDYSGPAKCESCSKLLVLLCKPGETMVGVLIICVWNISS